MIWCCLPDSCFCILITRDFVPGYSRFARYCLPDRLRCQTSSQLNAKTTKHQFNQNINLTEHQYNQKHLYPFFICFYLLIFYYQTPRQQWKMQVSSYIFDVSYTSMESATRVSVIVPL